MTVSAHKMGPRAKAVAWAGVLCGLVIVAICVYATPRVVEMWYISQLQADDDEQLKRAAEYLGQHGSAASIYPLLQTYARAFAKQKLPVAESAPDRFALRLIAAYKFDMSAESVFPELRDRDLKVPGSCAHAVLQIELRGGDNCVRNLTKASRDENVQIRHLAVALLRELSRTSKAALIVLCELYGSTDITIRYSVVEGLDLLESSDEALIPVLLAALRDTEPIIRYHASEAFEPIGEKGIVVVDEVIGLLNKEELCEDAIRALCYIGRAAKASEPRLRELLDHGNMKIRAAAEEALSKMR